MVKSGDVALMIDSDQANGRHQRPLGGGFHIPTAVWLAITTLVAFIALVLGAWATNRSRNITWADVQQPGGVFLANDPRVAASGFQNYGNLFMGTGYWTLQGRRMAYQRSDHGVLEYRGQIYVFGGASSISNDTGGPATAFILNATVLYDTYTGQQTVLKDMPAPLYRFGYGIIKDTLYVFGGYNIYDLGDGQANAQNITYAYNLESREWSTLGVESRLPVAVGDNCGASLNDKIYSAGGYNFALSNQAFKTVYEFDGRTWTPIREMDFPTGDCKAVGQSGQLFVLGGDYYSPPAALNCTDTEEYVGADGGPCFCPNDPDTCYSFSNRTVAWNPATNLWSNKTAMPFATGDFAIEVLPNDRIFTAGGESTSGARNKIATSHVSEYNTKLDTWVRKAPLPEARFRYDCAHLNETVYCFGGSPTTVCTDLTSTTCYNVGLDSVYAYFDLQYPDIYALVRN